MRVWVEVGQREPCSGLCLHTKIEKNLSSGQGLQIARLCTSPGAVAVCCFPALSSAAASTASGPRQRAAGRGQPGYFSLYIRPASLTASPGKHYGFCLHISMLRQHCQAGSRDSLILTYGVFAVFIYVRHCPRDIFTRAGLLLSIPCTGGDIIAPKSSQILTSTIIPHSDEAQG